MTYRVTTYPPNGIARSTSAQSLREAGKIIAYTIADNTRTDRKTCTRIAMEIERAKTGEYAGYRFSITREV